MAGQNEEVGGTSRLIQAGPVFKINELGMVMISKATECSDIWETDRDTKDAAKSLRAVV